MRGLATVAAMVLVLTAPAVHAAGETEHHKTVELDGLGSLKANLLDDSNVIEALGIPFAHPPLGKNRFRPAQPVRSWKHEGTRDATKFGPGCLQRSASFAVDEDCLNLNIWAPVPPKPPTLEVAPAAARTWQGSDRESDSNGTKAPPPGPPPPGQGLAVLVWAFGGGLTSGSGESYNGTNLTMAGQEPIIVVTINYRVGAFGFFASEEIAAEGGCGPNNASTTGAMNGVSDILEALRFVQAHIGAFGGDPTRVTLSGESSGSVASCTLAFSPQAQGLFHQVILESGVCTGPWMGPSSREEQFAVSAAIAADVNATSLEEMRKVKAWDIVNATHFDDPNFGVDGCLLTDDPVNLPLAMRGLADTPRGIIVGGNTLDTTCVGATGALDHPTDKATLDAHLETYFPGDVDVVLGPYRPYLEAAAAARAAGASPPPVPHDAWCNEFCMVWLTMNRDAGVTCPSLWLARQLSAFHPGAKTAVTVWLYQFNYNASVPGDSVNHGGELDAVWNRNTAFLSKDAESVSAAMGEYWASFVANGTPAFHRARKDWPEEWSPFRDADEERFLNVSGAHDWEGAEVTAGMDRYSGLFGNTCEAWEDYIRLGRTQADNFDTFGYLC